LEIIGHTDSKGWRNDKLSSLRAWQVQKRLIKAGIRPELLSYKGVAASQPISDEDTEEGKRKNRSVTFEVVMDKK